jgi:hypothetical protein
MDKLGQALVDAGAARTAAMDAAQQVFREAIEPHQAAYSAAIRPHRDAYETAQLAAQADYVAAIEALTGGQP